MLIEGNLLIGLLVGVSLVIAVIVIVVRFALKKDADGTGFTLFGRGGHAAADEEDAEAEDPMAARPMDDELSLPSLDELDDPTAGPNQKTAKPEKAKKEKAQGGIGAVIADLISNLLGRGKKKDEIKRDVKDIDEQLNQVLQESQNLGLDIPSSARVPDIGIMSESKSIHDIDKEMRSQPPLPEARKPEPAPQQPSIVGMNPYTQGGGIDLAPPEMPALSPEPPKAPAQARPTTEAPKPAASPKADSQPSDNVFKGAGAADSTHDLLSEIAADSVKEEVIDTTIMKDLQGVPIECEELEKDLTGILDQVSFNAQRGGKKKKADKPGGDAPVL